jgi:hypothetical protein
MDLKGILSISGQSGLYKLISQARNGIIVESLEDKKRMPAYASSKISSLEDIAIYTDKQEVPLNSIFETIYKKENGGPAINHKSQPDKLKLYFAEILPNYNRDKVYVSDIKRLLNWYNILQNLGLIKFVGESEPEVKEEELTLEPTEELKNE